MPSNHLILCCPLLLLPSIFPRVRVFSNELALHIGWPKYWKFSFNISPSNETLGNEYFRLKEQLPAPETTTATLQLLFQEYGWGWGVLVVRVFFPCSVPTYTGGPCGMSFSGPGGREIFSSCPGPVPAQEQLLALSQLVPQRLGYSVCSGSWASVL